MNKLIRKISRITLAALIGSTLVPVLAYAQVWFGDINYNADGTVTGQVYADHELTVTDATYQLQALDQGLDPIDSTVTSVTYSSYKDGKYYYDLGLTVTDDTYNPIKLQWDDPTDSTTTVTDWVYQPASGGDSGGSGSSGGSGGCWCGGGPIGGGTGNTDELNANADGTVDANALQQALASHDTVVIDISGNTAILPASALQNAKEDAVLIISNDAGTYQLPISVLDLDKLASQLDTDIASMSIRVSITPWSGDDAAKVAQSAQASGAALIGNPVAYELSAEVEGSSKSVAIDDFGHTYVTRTMNLGSVTVDSSKATGAIYDPDTGKMYFVPSTFQTTDGKTTASLMRNGNSVYAVVKADKSFTDTNSVPWAKDDITQLANKLIVYGESDTNFRPNWYITRAEFAALLVRSLGLDAEDPVGAKAFRDVGAGDWFAREVAIASADGLVYGDAEADTFRPNDPITREELAAMVVRAMKVAGDEPSSSIVDLANALSAFQDSAQVSGWAHTELAQAIESGIVYGESSTILDPRANATRAESAAMIRRFLSKVGFIN